MEEYEEVGTCSSALSSLIQWNKDSCGSLLLCPTTLHACAMLAAEHSPVLKERKKFGLVVKLALFKMRARCTACALLYYFRCPSVLEYHC